MRYNKIEIEVMCGRSIDQAVEDAIKLCREERVTIEVEFEFNGVKMIIDDNPGKDKSYYVNYYMNTLKKEGKRRRIKSNIIHKIRNFMILSGVFIIYVIILMSIIYNAIN